MYQNKDEKFYGASAQMSIWKPIVNLGKYNLAEISLRSGWDDQYSRIHVGWTVSESNFLGCSYKQLKQLVIIFVNIDPLNYYHC